jgi:hypothetical protein
VSDPFALTALFDGVKAQFEADGTLALMRFGWREPDKQFADPRVVIFVPGDTSGSVGQILPPKFPGGNPRNLATVDELATILIDARDSTNPENERAQYAAARLLFDDVYRAMYLKAHGRFAVRKVSWLIDKKVRRLGATIEMLITIQGTVPDVASGEVGPTTDVPIGFSAEVSELDVTTTIGVTEVPA